MTATTIRACGRAESALLAALHEACFDQGWDASSVDALLAMPGTQALLAVEIGDPVGFVVFRRAADEAEVLSIGVLPAGRRRGVGRSLLVAAEAHLRRAEVGRLFLEVAEDDTAARALYAAAGFEALGRRSGYYRRADGGASDALVMGKPLAPPVAGSAAPPISKPLGVRQCRRDGNRDERSVRTEVELTAKIVSAYLGRAQLPAEALKDTIKSVHASLCALGEAPAPAARTPAVPVARSIQPDYLICLENGRRLRSLKRHLRVAHGLTPEEYRARWGLPANYPMVAPNYARLRRELARAIGLGRQRGG